MVLASDQQIRNITTTLGNIKLQWDGNCYTVTWKYVKFSKRGGCFAPTDLVQSHAELMSRYLLFSHFAQRARCAQFPMGPLGALGAMGGQGHHRRPQGAVRLARLIENVAAALVK